MPTPRQPSFAGGELAPSLWGRTDLPRYPSSARRLSNFFVAAEGVAVSRPGTQFMCNAWGGVADIAGASGPPLIGHTPNFAAVGDKVRLIPFKWSDTDTAQNYILEFGDRYLRVLKNGAPVRVDPFFNGALPGAWSSGTTYAAADAIVYSGQAYVSLQAANLNHQPDISPTFWKAFVDVWGGGFTYAKGHDVVDLNDGHLYRSLQAANTNHTPHSSPTWWVALDGVIDSPYRVQELYKIRYAQSGDVITMACAGYAPYELSRTSENSWSIGAVDFSRPVPSPAISLRLMEESYGAVDGSHPVQPWSWRVTEVSRNARGLLIESAPVKMDFAMVWYGDRWNANIPYLGRDAGATRGTAVSHADAVRDTYWTCLVSNTGRDPGLLADAVNGYSGTDQSSWFVHGKTTGYNSGWLYPLGAVTQSGGIYYRSKGGANTGHAPPNATWWDVLPDDGITGYWQQDDLAAFEDLDVCLYPDRQLQLWICPASTSNSANFICYKVYRGRAGVFGWVGDSNPGDPSDSTVQLFTDDGKDPDFTQCPPQGLNPFEVHDDSGALVRTESPIAVAYFEDRLVFAGTNERPAFIFASATGDYHNFDQRLYGEDAASSLVFAMATRDRQLARSIVGLQKLLVLTDAAAWAVDGSQGAPLAPDSIDARAQVAVGADWPMPLIVEGAILWVRNKGTGVRRIAYDTLRQSFTSSDLSMVSKHLVLGHKIIDWCYAEDPWGVVWAVRDDGVLLSLTYAPEEELWAWAQHGVCPDANDNPGVVQSIATIPEGDEDAVYLAMTGSGATAWILRMSTRLEVPAQDPALQPPIKLPVCLDAYVAPGVINGTDQMTLGGLGQFEGRPVWALVKSGFSQQYTPYGPVTVSLGQVVIQRSPALHTLWAEDVVLVGLPYEPELELLDLAEGRLGQKIVNEVGLEVKASGPLWAGESFPTLKEQTKVTSETDIVRVHIAGVWNTGGRAAIRQVQPLPLTVLGVTRKVENAR